MIIYNVCVIEPSGYENDYYFESRNERDEFVSTLGDAKYWFSDVICGEEYARNLIYNTAEILRLQSVRKAGC